MKSGSDLGVRTASAIVMVAVAGAALWLGGYAWAAFVALVAAGVLWEWTKLSGAIAQALPARAAWFFAGLVYVGVAAEVLLRLRAAAPADDSGWIFVLFIVASVIATDVGAYFSGRHFGGPKIAPSISPSKTWAGLVGGMIAAPLALIACLIVAGMIYPRGMWGEALPVALVAGPMIAIIAQAGDFFESWMKRRAGVKDSGHLIPGHGGLFDRVDGLLAVLFVAGIVVGLERFL